MDTMKNKDYHLKISDEKLKIIELIAKQDRIRKSQVFERAIDNYLKIKWYNRLNKSK